MIKKVAKNNLKGYSGTCMLCKRIVKKGQQYLIHQGYPNMIFHVRCIMDMCGKEIEPGMVWKTPKEIEKEERLAQEKIDLEQWLAGVRKAKKQGKSILDVGN